MKNANFLLTFATATGALDLAVVRAESTQSATVQAQTFLNTFNKGYKVVGVSLATPEENKAFPALGELDDL